MAVLRSSLFTARVGDKDVQIGLAGLIEIFRLTIDRDVDRVRAGPRATSVANIMQEVSFVSAAEPLTSMCLNLLQNVGAEERAQVEQKVAALANQAGRSDSGKALELGLILAGTVGFPVLEAAAEKLAENINVGTPREELVAKAMRCLSPTEIMVELPATCLALAQTMSEEDQTRLGEGITDIRLDEELSLTVKALNIGILLINFVGEEVFVAAVSLLDEVMTDPPSDRPAGLISDSR